jgi:hypothetical protein
MRLGGAGADDEKIRERRNPAEIDGDDVLGFFVRNEMRADTG